MRNRFVLSWAGIQSESTLDSVLNCQQLRDLKKSLHNLTFVEEAVFDEKFNSLLIDMVRMADSFSVKTLSTDSSWTGYFGLNPEISSEDDVKEFPVDFSKLLESWDEFRGDKDDLENEDDEDDVDDGDDVGDPEESFSEYEHFLRNREITLERQLGQTDDEVYQVGVRALRKKIEGEILEFEKRSPNSYATMILVTQPIEMFVSGDRCVFSCEYALDRHHVKEYFNKVTDEVFEHISRMYDVLSVKGEIPAAPYTEPGKPVFDVPIFANMAKV